MGSNFYGVPIAVGSFGFFPFFPWILCPLLLPSPSPPCSASAEPGAVGMSDTRNGFIHFKFCERQAHLSGHRHGAVLAITCNRGKGLQQRVQLENDVLIVVLVEGELLTVVGEELPDHVPQADDALHRANQTHPSLGRVLRDLKELIQQLELKLLELLLESGRLANLRRGLDNEPEDVARAPGGPRDVVGLVIKTATKVNQSTTFKQKFEELQLQMLDEIFKTTKHASQRWLSLVCTWERTSACGMCSGSSSPTTARSFLSTRTTTRTIFFRCTRCCSPFPRLRVMASTAPCR